MQRYKQNNQSQPLHEVNTSAAGIFISPPPHFTPKTAAKTIAISGDLGNYTSYGATPVKSTISENVSKLKYDTKHRNIELKKRIGKKVDRVAGCGVRRISKIDKSSVDVVRGKSGNVYYSGMQRCGSVWLCPDCSYKIAKVRAEETYRQLMVYHEQNRQVYFVSFTLQHNVSQSLEYLWSHLSGGWSYARKHRKYNNLEIPVEYVRTYETMYGESGHHPHIHALFVGDSGTLDKIKLFAELYKKYLSKNGFYINEHTVQIDAWNGKSDTMSDYLFKGMIEHEMTAGSLKRAKNAKGGKSFFELVSDDNTRADIIDEYISVTKGKKQFQSSSGFFKDIKTETDEEILHDDAVDTVLMRIPHDTYKKIMKAGIAWNLLAEIKYRGSPGADQLLISHNIDVSFLYDEDGILIDCCIQ